MKYYTGIGSRETPYNILREMRHIASALACHDFILRSGGANGADTAFETGCDIHDGSKTIYLPWKGFNGNESNLYDVDDDALELAGDVYGSGWKYRKMPVKLLMARNVYQVVGMNLDTPSEFVVCWTPDGCESEKNRKPKTGGTGQAIALASRSVVPVFNLANKGRIEEFRAFMEKQYGLH